MDAETSVLAVGFDSGSAIRNAIRDGKMYGAVTRSPFETGISVVKTLYAIAQGQEVSDISVKGCWYDSENMEDDAIASNLYD